MSSGTKHGSIAADTFLYRLGERWIEVISGGFSILGSRGELSVRTEGDNPLLGSAEGVVIVGS